MEGLIESPHLISLGDLKGFKLSTVNKYWCLRGMTGERPLKTTEREKGLLH